MMYIFFLFLFLLILTVFDCFALSDDSLISKPDLFGIDGSTDDSPINFGSPIGGNTDEDYSEFEKYLPLVDATEPPTLFTMDPDFNTDPLFTTEIGTDGTSSIFADASQGDCSFGISLLPDRLKKQRRGVTSCHSPYSSSRDSDTVPGDSVGGAALNVDPKVAPYLNIETMELNEICPAQSLINQYYIPVCSSSVKGYTKRYPPVLPTYWQLMDAQLITVGVLLQCHTNRFIFCCGKFIPNYHVPIDVFNEGLAPTMRFTGWGDLCQFLDPMDEIFYHGIEPAQFF